MAQGLPGKWIEVVILVAAGIGFVVWQLRDTNRALERSRAERLAREARERKAQPHDDPPREHPPS
jgi:heme exporter protein D